MKKKQCIRAIAGAMALVTSLSTITPALTVNASEVVGERKTLTSFEATAEQLGGELLVTIPDEMVLVESGDYLTATDYVHAEGIVGPIDSLRSDTQTKTTYTHTLKDDLSYEADVTYGTDGEYVFSADELKDNIDSTAYDQPVTVSIAKSSVEYIGEYEGQMTFNFNLDSDLMAAIDPNEYLNVSESGLISIDDSYKIGGENENDLPSTITIPSTIDGNEIKYIDTTTFENIPNSITKLNIPDELWYIEEGALDGMDNLAVINIDSSSGAMSGQPWGAENTTVNWDGVYGTIDEWYVFNDDFYFDNEYTGYDRWGINVSVTPTYNSSWHSPEVEKAAMFGEALATDGNYIDSAGNTWNAGEPIPDFGITYNGEPISSVGCFLQALAYRTGGMSIDRLDLTELRYDNVVDAMDFAVGMTVGTLDMTDTYMPNVLCVNSFLGATNIDTLMLDDFSAPKVKGASSFFYNAEIETASFKNMDLGSPVNMSGFLSGSNISFNLSNTQLDFSECEDLSYFANGFNGNTLDLSGANFSSVTKMNDFASRCETSNMYLDDVTWGSQPISLAYAFYESQIANATAVGMNIEVGSLMATFRNATISHMGTLTDGWKLKEGIDKPTQAFAGLTTVDYIDISSMDFVENNIDAVASSVFASCQSDGIIVKDQNNLDYLSENISLTEGSFRLK